MKKTMLLVSGLLIISTSLYAKKIEQTICFSKITMIRTSHHNCIIVLKQPKNQLYSNHHLFQEVYLLYF